MKLIVGLGNPGQKYENTRHNTGYLTADAVAEKLNAHFNREAFKSLIAKTVYKGEQVIIMKVRHLSYPQMIRDFIRDEGIMRYINIQICPSIIQGRRPALQSHASEFPAQHFRYRIPDTGRE